MKLKALLARGQANFLTGLAIVLPAAISIGLLVWLFSSIASVTDALLFFLPPQWTHRDHGTGPMYWYWSLVALILAVFLTCLIGQLARYYLGKKIIQLTDAFLLRVPLLNKVYGALKQVNEAFTTGNKSSFKQAVLVEFPRPGQYAVGFITGEGHETLARKIPERLVSVFIPTTPNPTSGFMVLMPEHQVTKLDLSVADGIKFIISLGALAPEAPANGGKAAAPTPAAPSNSPSPST